MQEREKNKERRKKMGEIDETREREERENLTSSRGGREKRGERSGYHTPRGENLGIPHRNEPQFQINLIHHSKTALQPNDLLYL